MRTVVLLDREWVTIRDPEDDHRRFTFDVSFLLSGYHCIYGRGCPGIRPEGPDEVAGCCTHGAYLAEEDDAEAIAANLELLSPDSMEYHAEAVSNGVFETDRDGETRTRIVDGACIFLNRGGTDAGPGCALHQLSMQLGEHHVSRKPVVCWQLPLHRTIDEQTGNDGQQVEVHTVAAFERGHWGDGGADFHWWCTEAPEAFTSARPVYRTMEVELRTMVGDEVYEELRRYLRGRRRQRNAVRFLPVVP